MSLHLMAAYVSIMGWVATVSARPPNSPPPIFITALIRVMLGAFEHLMSGDLDRAAASFAAAIPTLEENDKVRAGTAYCCYAHCLKEAGEYKEAIKAARDRP